MLNLFHCRSAQKEHDLIGRRQYCHVFHKDNVICKAHEFDYLPINFKLGIILHELGHLAGCSEEWEADEFIRQWAKIKILRVDSEYGDNLEYIRDCDIMKALKIIKMYVRSVA